ncbi:MAG TPA: phenylalanine--tRNA ligase subunit beta [Candidatus Saccharimonadales bacterium]|nr:phenylalanine--tRNA ligase subunit beta [Candidatus Saccharimonadales bacterium]
MKVSIEFMKRYSGDEQWQLTPEELVAKIGRQLGAVEESEGLAARYAGIAIVQITEAKPHPNADKLSVYQMTNGTETVQVVSGDTSLNVGDKVAWIAPGQTVPSTHGTSAPVVMEARPLRGEVSNGMFGSGRELGLNEDHQKVLVLDTNEPAGTLLADAYNLNDTIIDIENKMFTHRPDGFGNLGVAREIAGIQGLPFASPEWYAHDAVLPAPQANDLKVTVRNEIPELVPRFVATPLANITIAPSPLWMQSFLQRIGVRPINNVVDITNYYMVLTGQPLHAYDYDKVKALCGGDKAELVVRKPRKGETIELLNGKTIEPHADTMMVYAGEVPACVGGMIGGSTTEVDASTKTIILEGATWDMFSIRRTSMHHGIFTDAVTRFSKGQSPLQNTAVVAKAVADMQELAGAVVAGESVDVNHVGKDAMVRGSVHAPIALSEEFINTRLGTHLRADDIAVILNNVEIAAEVRGAELIVTPPFWRTDLEIPEDIVEEVGRLHGFDQLPHELPTRSTSAVSVSKRDTLKNRIRNLLAAAGANELQTYSFVPAKLMQDVGQNPEHAFAIRNALSPELQHYRMSLTPGLIEKIHPNIKSGYGELALFEIGKVHIKNDLDCDGLPREYQTLAFAYAAKAGDGSPFYQAKYYLEYVLNALNVPHTYVSADAESPYEIGRQIFAPFESKRSGYLLIGEEGEFGGFVGEYTAKARKALKLPDYAAGFEIDIDRVLKHQRATAYQSLLKFPATEQDVCLRVESPVRYADLERLVSGALAADERLRVGVAPLDIYQREDDAAHKQITFRITLQHTDRTLTTNEVNTLLDTMVQSVQAQLPAERI